MAAESASAARVDPVGCEVIRGALETVAYEMATHVSLTATTPILNQSNERNATILDARGRLAALSVGIPQFMLSSTLPVRFALEFFQEEGLNEGDVLVANDPYHGGGHLPDYNVFAPVVVDGELVLIASIQCHHADTGGGMPGGYNVEALDIWAEGVRFPAVKLWDRGRERRDVLYLLQTNNRTPTFIGDIRAQIGAAQLGAQAPRGNHRAPRRRRRARRRRLLDRLRRAPLPRGGVGLARRPLCVRRLRRPRSQGQSRHPRALRGDGRERSPDGRLHGLRHAAESLQAWSTFGNTRGYVVSQLASMMDPAIPKNEGFFDAIELIVPEGCCLNPKPGRSVAAGTHHPGVEVGEAIALALAQVIPERACPQIYKAGMPAILYGVHPRDGPGLRRSLRRFDRGLLRRGARPGWLGLGQRRLWEPDQGDGGDQRIDLSDAPRASRLQPRHGRSREVARLPGLPLREAADVAGRGLHVSGRHEVSDAGHRGWPQWQSESFHAARGQADAAARHAHREPGAARGG